MNDVNMDAAADLNYSGRDPQFADVDEQERESQREALDEVISTLETALLEFKAVKQNFTTRKYNRFILALEQIRDEVKEERDNV